MNPTQDKKIHNFGCVDYNRFEEQIEYSYFEKQEDGTWEEYWKQESIQNDIFLPNSDAVVNQVTGNTPNLQKDIFGNPILTGVTQPFYAKNLSHSIRKCPIRFSIDVDPTTKFLAKRFEFNEERDEIPPLRVQYMDIETVIDDYGFLQGWDVGPDRKGRVRGGITLISSYDVSDDQTTIFGINPYQGTLPARHNYIWCKDERGILREYMKYLKRTDVHILTGWNISDYDIPYILNRMLLHFGKKSLRHFGHGSAWIKNEARRYIINRINVIDYMVLYKKFELTPRRSYKLADIVDEEEVEIGGQGKIEYEGSMKSFYTKDWEGFVRYCIQDAKLVFQLEEKKELLKTFILCCYMAGISFNRAISKDVSWLRIHDAAIYRFCQQHDLVLPESKEPSDEDGKFLGAYVMEPKPGLYDYITVYDVASLYPSCIQSLNISLETYRGQVKNGDVVKQKGPFLVEFYSPLWLSLGEYQETILESYNQYHKEKLQTTNQRPQLKEFKTFPQLRRFLNSKNYSIAANGAIFTKDFRGIIPSLIDKWIAIRKKNKKLYFDYKEKYQKSNNAKDKALSDRYNTIQKVYKIRLNSLYGFVGAKWSRFYHTDLAEAVTATGQYVIKSTMEALKKHNPLFATLYIDTDSLFLDYKPILKYRDVNLKDGKSERIVQECLDIDRVITDTISEHLQNITTEVMQSDNFYKFETEDLFSKLLITSKKKYVAERLYDKSTHRILKDDFETKGMDFKKSNLSKPIKKFLKNLTIQIMRGITKEKTIRLLRTMFNKMPNLPIEDIAYVQGVRSLWTYEKETNISIQDRNRATVYFPKKTPYHIAGVLAANELIDWDSDLHEMKKIGEGDKAYIVFVCPTNLFGVKAIAVSEWHPKLYEYFKLDVEYMMQRLILGPMKATFEAVKFNITMDDILQYKFVDADNTMIQTLLF